MNSVVALPLSAVSIVPFPIAAFGGNGIDDLWLQRLQILRAGHSNRHARTAAVASLPSWAQPGPRSVDHNGNPCGQIVGWPEKAVHPGPASSPGMHRIVRVSLKEIRDDFERYVSMFASMKDAEAPGRKQARETYRMRMREAVNRLRAQRACEDAVGLDAIDAQSELIGEALWDVEERISALPSGFNVTAARIMTEVSYVTESDETVKRPRGSLRVAVIALEGVRGSLTGTIRRSVDLLLDNPERPFGETELALY